MNLHAVEPRRYDDVASEIGAPDFHTGLLCRARRARPRAQSFCRKRNNSLGRTLQTGHALLSQPSLVLDARPRRFEDEARHYGSGRKASHRRPWKLY